MYNHIPVEEWGKGKHVLPKEWYKFGRRLIFKGAKISIFKLDNNIPTTKYRVTLDEGDWPKTQDLIDVCDSFNHNFGGRLENVSAKECVVCVYVD